MIFFSNTLYCGGIKSYLRSTPLFLSGEMLLKFLPTALNEICQGTKRSSPFVTSDSNQAYYIAMLFDGFNDVVSIRGRHMSEEDTCCISVSPNMKLYTEMKKRVNLNKHESGSICIERCRGMCSYYALTEPYK